VTEAAGPRTVSLPDGSKVRLNGDSEVIAEFSDGVRSVTLARGEAHFDVARDTRRPFVVTAGGVDVRAVGTAFLVRRAEGEVEVLVTAGVVGVNFTTNAEAVPDGIDVRRLEAGQRTVLRSPAGSLAFASAGPVETWTNAEIDRRLDWTLTRLDFRPTPLRDVVAEMNRHNVHRLRIADPALEELSVGGSFRIGDHETFVLLLEASFGLRVERKEGETVLHGRPEAALGREPYSANGDK
jgi:transmembrane sensor